MKNKNTYLGLIVLAMAAVLFAGSVFDITNSTYGNKYFNIPSDQQTGVRHYTVQLDPSERGCVALSDYSTIHQGVTAVSNLVLDGRAYSGALRRQCDTCDNMILVSPENANRGNPVVVNESIGFDFDATRPVNQGPMSVLFTFLGVEPCVHPVSALPGDLEALLQSIAQSAGLEAWQVLALIVLLAIGAYIYLKG